MKVYSVTVSYEDEHEGQWVHTFAVLARDPESAGRCAQAHVEGFGEFLLNVTTKVNGVWQGDIQPRVIASLMPDLTGITYVWRAIR